MFVLYCNTPENELTGEARADSNHKKNTSYAASATRGPSRGPDLRLVFSRPCHKLPRGKFSADGGHFESDRTPRGTPPPVGIKRGVGRSNYYNTDLYPTFSLTSAFSRQKPPLWWLTISLSCVRELCFHSMISKFSAEVPLCIRFLSEVKSWAFSLYSCFA